MITRNLAGGNLSAGFITKLQTRYEFPQIVFRFQTDSTTDLNEALDDAETTIDVDDNSVFSDGDIITIQDEWMLITDAAVGANQIEVTRGYGISIAEAHDTGKDIYIMAEYDTMDVSDISVDPDLASSEAVVTVSNADQFWNLFLTAPENHGNLALIELKFSGLAENMVVYTGVVDHVEYSDRDMTASLYLGGRLDKFLAQEIDPSPGTLDMVNGPSTNPADFIWDILIDEGGLDDTESQDNKHIDYTKWDAWKTKLTAQNFDIGARIPRMLTYRAAIQAILYLCSSWGFQTNEGKIAFDYAANDAGGGDDTWTQAHIIIFEDGSKVEGNRPIPDLAELINNQFISHGYDSTTGIWQSELLGTVVNNQEATSQGNFGIFAAAEANPLVWHSDATSAQGGSDWVEDIHANPRIFTELRTWLYGARMEIGDVVDLTDADWAWTNKLMKVERVMAFNMSTFVPQFLLRA